jgi:formylmethanofuran dehydrogenase subunit D
MPNAEASSTSTAPATVGRDLDIGGLSYALLDRNPARSNGRCAPALRVRQTHAPLRRRRVSHRQRPRPLHINAAPAAAEADRRAPSAASQHRPPARPVARHEPHRRGVAPVRPCPEPVLEMHPRDMERRGIVDGDLVRLKGKRGSLLLRAAASNTLRPAQTYVPMHWGGQFMSGLGVNALTLPVTDPVSRQPELKHAAVQVEKFTVGWQLVAMRRDDEGGLHAALHPWLARFDHATLTLAGRDSTVVVLRAWGGEGSPVPSPDMLAELAAATGLDAPHMLAFNDTRCGIAKRALIEGRPPRRRPAVQRNPRHRLAARPHRARRQHCRSAQMAVRAAGNPARRWSGARPHRLQLLRRFRIRNPRRTCSRPRSRRPSGKAQVRQQLRLLSSRTQAHGRTIGDCGAGQRLTKQRAGLIGWKQAP